MKESTARLPQVRQQKFRVVRQEFLWKTSFIVLKKTSLIVSRLSFGMNLSHLSSVVIFLFFPSLECRARFRSVISSDNAFIVLSSKSSFFLRFIFLNDKTKIAPQEEYKKNTRRTQGKYKKKNTRKRHNDDYEKAKERLRKG